MTIGMDSAVWSVSVAMASGLVLFQDDMDIGTYEIMSISVRQSNLYYTSKAKVTYGRASRKSIGPYYQRRWNLAPFSSKDRFVA